MEINPNPPGLLSRRVFRIGNGRVVIEEQWNIDAPGCPMILNPWCSPPDCGPLFVRQVEMSEEECQDIFRDVENAEY
jgi:hypothetical protein